MKIKTQEEKINLMEKKMEEEKKERGKLLREMEE
jgi:hypothetical protein